MSTALSKHAHGALTKYDPQKGVKTIRALEAVQKHWAKARDITMLEAAIRAKLEAQAEFVLWWDTTAQKDQGARQPGSRRGREKTTASDHLSDYGLDKFLVHQWRKKLDDPDRFKETLAIELEHARWRLECERREKRVSKNTGESEWYTPADLIAAARQVLGEIDLDPASTPEANVVIKATKIFTARDDALMKIWRGRVWMNPPYSQPFVAAFCDKLAESVRAGTVVSAVVLVNNATETAWFRTLVGVAATICFPSGRVRFWSPGKDRATPLQGQAVLYIGADTKTFFSAFKPFGWSARIER